MIGSNNRRWAFLAALFSSVCAFSAAAQAPPSAIAPLGDEAKEPVTPREDAAAADATHTGIAVGVLAAPSPDAMGLIDTRGGGFPDTMWQSSQSDTARHLIAQLPRRYVTLSARRLARRFLLSAAPPPPDRAGTTIAGVPGGALLQARVAALAAMGDWTDALALIDLVPPERRSPEMQRTRIDGLLIEDKIDGVCGEVQLALSEKPDAYWQKIQVLCQFAADHGAAAGLTLDLLHEQDNDDHGFFWAVETVQGTVAPPPGDLIGANGSVPALTLALLRRAGRDLPSPLAESDDPTVLTVAAQIAAVEKPAEPAPPVRRPAAKGAAAKPAPAKVESGDEARIHTVERAVAAGVADPAILRTVYGRVEAKHDAGDVERISVGTAQQRAVTYQLAVAQTVPASRAEVIARAYDLSRTKDKTAASMDSVTVGLVYAGLVRQIGPSPELAWFAGTAVRIMIAADSAGIAESQGEEARGAIRAWSDLAQNAPADPHGVNAQLWPFRQIENGGKFSRDSLRLWRAVRQDAASGDAEQEMLLNLLTALGDGVTVADWQARIDDADRLSTAKPSPMPSPAAWNALTLAAQGHGLGETVALSLQFLGGGAVPNELIGGKVLASLIAVDRAADARAIAAELALARGL